MKVIICDVCGKEIDYSEIYARGEIDTVAENMRLDMHIECAVRLKNSIRSFVEKTRKGEGESICR